MFDDPQKGVDERRIEMAPALPFHFGDRLVDRPRFLVGTLLNQRVEDVGDRDDPAGQRNRIPRDARVALPSQRS